MKNFLLVCLTLLIILGAAVGWPLYRQHQALLLDHARAQNRILELEGTSARLQEERDAVKNEVQGLTDRLAGREAEMNLLTQRVEENEAHLTKMAAELFLARDSLRACEKARSDLARTAAEPERRIKPAQESQPARPGMPAAPPENQPVPPGKPAAQPGKPPAQPGKPSAP